MVDREQDTSPAAGVEQPEAEAHGMPAKASKSDDAAGGPTGGVLAGQGVRGPGECAGCGGSAEEQKGNRAPICPAQAQSADGRPGTKGSRPSEVSEPAHFSLEQLGAARQEAVFQYDTARYPFEVLMRRLCGLGADDVELGMLHMLAQSFPEKPPLSIAMMHGFKVAGFKMPKKWNKALGYKRDRLKRFLDSRAFKDFQETYHRFINEIVLPIVGDAEGVVFQDPPTFRVQVPSNSAMGIPHKDADYECHVDEEINIWVPLTKVWGANTLHVESIPEKGDFHPLECEYGQFVRFWGNQCHHYTVANSTDATRVSFDFRLIPRTLYTNPFKNHIGDYPVAESKRMADVHSPPETPAMHTLCLDDRDQGAETRPASAKREDLDEAMQ